MKLAEVSIKRPVLATVMIGVLLVFGIYSYPKIGVDLMPDIEFPVVTVTAVYPGADPESVETKVVDKLEEAINTVSSIKVLRSTSMENVGMVVVQFELERDADQAVQDVRDKVSAALKDLPADLEPPAVEKLDFGAAPIMAIALASKRPVVELTELADEVLKERLQTVPGVGGIDIVGGQDREFKVWIDPVKLSSYGLTIADAMNSLRAQNLDVPGGRVDTGPKELVVKTHGQVKSAAELAQMILTSSGGAPVRIADIARVEDGTVEKRSHSTLNGESAVALLIRKQSGGNTVEVAQRVRTALETLKPQLPADLRLTIPNDNSIYIEKAILGVQEDLVLGAVLAVLIVLFFMRDWRATLISSLALPTSVISTVLFIKVAGYTFNFMTMLALSLSIGMLIDDAIVVIENIHRHLEMGKPPMKAAADGVAEIGLAVMATTASIVAVFLPVATMKGMIGRFFLQFGTTVAVAVTISLFVAFTLTPMLSSRLLKISHRKPNPLSAAIGAGLDAITAVYRRLLAVALRLRWVTVLLAVAIFAGSVGLASRVPGEFMTQEDRGMFKLVIETPTGTSLQKTIELVESVEKTVRQLPWVETTFATVGASQGEVNRSEVQVNLVPKDRRSFTQDEATIFVRKQFAGRTDARYAVEPVQSMGGNSGGMRAATVQYNLRGNDYDALNRDAAKIMQEMRQLGGYVDLDTSYRGGKPELAVNIDRERAADLGVPVAVIASTVRSYFAGEKVSEVVVDGERHDVRLQLPEEFRRNPEDIRNVKVRSASGQLVPLSSLVSVTPGEGPAKIDRQNRMRQVTVMANLEGKVVGTATTEVDALGAKYAPEAVRDWTGMADIMRDSFGNMIAALILAVVMVYLILAAQFESFLHPFTIMLSLPLSMVGAIGGLLLTGMTLNIMSMIGIIMLMGLVTKNAILLVDYTNTLREQGMERSRALLEAGAIRLRPILMTTLAMILGMLPVALAMSEGGEQRAPMAVAVIGGLITSTMLTLVVVPVAYQILDQFKDWVLGHRRPTGHTPAPASLTVVLPQTVSEDQN